MMALSINSPNLLCWLAMKPEVIPSVWNPMLPEIPLAPEATSKIETRL